MCVILVYFSLFVSFPSHLFQILNNRDNTSPSLNEFTTFLDDNACDENKEMKSKLDKNIKLIDDLLRLVTEKEDNWFQPTNTELTIVNLGQEEDVKEVRIRKMPKEK